MSSEIWRERAELDKARREFMRQAMAEYDKAHYEKLRALQERCEHKWRFTDFGSFGEPWYSCSLCHKTRVELKAEGG